MKYIIKRIKINFLLALAAIMILSSCNKELEQIPGPPAVIQDTTPNLGTLLSDPNFSIFKAAVVKANLLATLQNPSLRFTVFAPDNAACIASGIPSEAAIAGLSVASVTSLVSYHIIPQAIPSASISNAFPNFQYPTILNPTTGTPAFNPLVRLTTSPSTRNGIWVNNIPIITADIQAVNGILHKVVRVVAPPKRAVWERINTDVDLTIFKAAIQRADEGVAPTGPASLIWALSNFGPNLTVFAPSNMAFKNLISALTGGMIPVAAPDATFIAFLGSASVTTQTIKGIVVYHLLGSRAFSNNFPIVATSYPTLLNGAVAAHPGVSLQCMFTAGVVTSATAKGVVNATASNIVINPVPDTEVAGSPLIAYIGTSDQHYINGTLHKIDQVLLPQ